MAISIDKIVDGFPHPNIAPIVGMIPTYESIAKLNLQLKNANAASVQSNLGDVQLGLLAMTVSLAVFNTLSAIAFVHPVNPGTNPVIPPGATTTHVRDYTCERRHISLVILLRPRRPFSRNAASDWVC
jgi:hypothetical protein